MPFLVEGTLWGILITSTATDLARGKIYNALTIPAFFMGLIFKIFTLPLGLFFEHFLFITVLFALCFPFFKLRLFGAGDVKLLLALAAWTEPQFTLKLLALAVVMGAGVGALVLINNRLGFFEDKFLGPKTRLSKTGTPLLFAPAFLSAFMLLKISTLSGWHF